MRDYDLVFVFRLHYSQPSLAGEKQIERERKKSKEKKNTQVIKMKATKFVLMLWMILFAKYSIAGDLETENDANNVESLESLATIGYDISELSSTDELRTTNAHAYDDTGSTTQIADDIESGSETETEAQTEMTTEAETETEITTDADNEASTMPIRVEIQSSNGIKCKDGLLLPVWRPTENLTNGDRFARGLVYFFALCYLFLGVSIVSDRFMAAIEKITAIEKTIKVRRPDGTKQTIVVRVWNETVANLTLMVICFLFFCFSMKFYRILSCFFFFSFQY